MYKIEIVRWFSGIMTLFGQLPWVMTSAVLNPSRLYMVFNQVRRPSICQDLHMERSFIHHSCRIVKLRPVHPLLVPSPRFPPLLCVLPHLPLTSHPLSKLSLFSSIHRYIHHKSCPAFIAQGDQAQYRISARYETRLHGVQDIICQFTRDFEKGQRLQPLAS